MKVVFDTSGVHLYQELAKVDGVSVASGTRRGNLYEIEIPVAIEEKVLIAEVDKNTLLWHCRLGHVGEQALQRLLKDNMVTRIDAFRVQDFARDVCLPNTFEEYFLNLQSMRLNYLNLSIQICVGQ
ncbi:hypothetical protein R1flu_027299 [Riccia fluitans]|uniref:GAG-pre-integrase domain-containing protein n=1 Tax=Riccia fluitans TaxID=41844 RepID=A0ABD1XLF1_9MARC